MKLRSSIVWPLLWNGKTAVYIHQKRQDIIFFNPYSTTIKIIKLTDFIADLEILFCRLLEKLILMNNTVLILQFYDLYF